MIPPISQRMLRVQAPMIPVVGEMIKRHAGTISLGQGVVHYGPPACVAEAAAHALATDPRVHRYALALGVDSLLDAIRAKLKAENATTVGHVRRIAVTAGSNMGFLNAVLAIADPGDEIILLSPFYFNHEMAVDIAGCRAVVVPTDRDYQPDPPLIEAAITARTRAIVTISPNNPTGAVYPAATLEAINTLCKNHGIYHIADEAYEYFTYGQAEDFPPPPVLRGRAGVGVSSIAQPNGSTPTLTLPRSTGGGDQTHAPEHFSPGSLSDSEAHTISLYSLSKAYGMAGWRVGYMVMPAHLEESVKKIQDTNLICPPILNQLAAAAAFTAGREWCRAKIRPFAGIRDMVLGELQKLGDRIYVPTPGGAFYALTRVHSDRKDMELVEALISRFGVAVMPGSTFGVAEGCYLRIAYGALDGDTVAEGMERLVRGLREIL